MTTTELIQLLQKVEKGASGRSREIKIYTQTKKGTLKKAVLKESDKLEIVGTGDGFAGAELSLAIVSSLAATNNEAEYCNKCGKRIKMKGDGTIELLCECSEVTVCPRYHQCFNPCKSEYCTLETVSLNGCFVGQTDC